MGLEVKVVSLNQLTERVIGACVEVHKHLGPGLLESAYEECLAYELRLRGFSFTRQQQIPVIYKGAQLNCGYVMDIVVEETVLLELKSVETLLPIHEAQLLTYLKLTGLPCGLLINSNTDKVVRGIKRMLNNHYPKP